MTTRPDPNTLAYHLDTGGAIRAYCMAPGCDHSAEIDLARLADKLSREHGALLTDLKPHLKCSACGSRDMSIRIHPNVAMTYAHQ